MSEVDECGIFKMPCFSSHDLTTSASVRDQYDCPGGSSHCGSGSGSRHPHMENPSYRLRSFATWPVSLFPRPQALVDAGFFYTGESDRCVCFSCGNGLSHWEVTDDPWVEHKTYFPSCPFIIKEGERMVTKKSSSLTEVPEPTQTALPEALLCKVCFLKQMCVTFLPCKHVSTCESCASRLTHCPVCRVSIKSSFKVFLQ